MDSIRFGVFELDPRTGELRRGSEIVPLAPQPFRLLLALAERPGELVTREELRQKLWDDGTFVDYERGLNFCVLQVRTALGDDAKSPQYIETLPKRGYRFVARPERGAAGFSAPKDDGGLKPAAPQVVFIVLAVVAILFAAAWQMRPTPTPQPGRTTLAVLPFEDLSAAPDAHFADGLTEELITHLGRLQPRRLGVIARSSSVGYRGTKKSVREIGRELGVDYLAMGSVRREGDRVRVSAQLIETERQTHLWSESFDRSGTGALAIQQDVAGRIAQALRVELLEDPALTARSPEAHEAYLRGRHLWHQGDTPSVNASIRELREAIRLEPGFVLPYIALAESFHSLAMRERVTPAVAREEIRRGSEAALRLAPSLAQSHGITAMLRFWYDWDWDAAEGSYRRAIELNPNEPGTLHDHGWLLITRGAFDEGLAQIRRAQELDPVSPRANAHVAWAYIYTRRYPLAVREARRALALSPEFAEGYRCLEHAYLLSGDVASAREARSHHPPTAGAPSDTYGRAVEAAMAGDRETSLKWLAAARQERNTSFALAGVDPKLDSLHGDARFEELLAEAGLRALRPPSR